VKRPNITRILFFTALLFATFSCRKVFNKADWEPEAVFPLAHTELTYTNIVTDSTYIHTDSTGLASIVFEQQLDSLSLSVLDTFSAPPFNSKFKLDSLRLEVPPFEQTITLGQLARQLQASSDPIQSYIGTSLLALHGNNIASNALLSLVVPATIPVPIGSIPVDLNQFFKTAELSKGTVTLKIQNEFPMDIDRLDFSVQNATDNAVLLQETNIRIPKKTTFEKDYDLAGKTVEGQLLVAVPTLNLLTDKQAIIDTNQFIYMNMSFSNLQVFSATAIFPDQDVVSDYQAASLEDMGEMELKEAWIEEGMVVMDVISTLQDSIFMSYSMPKTTFNGSPLIFNGVVPPAPPSGTNAIRLEVPVKDYVLNLSSPTDYFNRFVYEFKAHVKYTGKQVYLSLKDSIVVNVYMRSIRPKYVRGYLGSLDTSYTSFIETDVFSKIQAEAISPATVNVRLKVENSLGVKGTVQFEYLKASNAKGQSLDAQDDQMIGVPLSIAAATDHPLTTVGTLIQNGPNSNFPELIGLMPNRFDFKVQTHVGGLPKDSNSFVYNTSKLKSKLEIDMPLHLSVQGLMLRDTIDLGSSQITFENAGGALTLVAYNGFPFNGTIKATFVSNGTSQQVVLNGTSAMLSADVDPSTGKAIGKKRSAVVLPFTQNDLANMVQAKQLILEARFDTPQGQKVKMYSDYTTQLTLTAKVAPKISR